MIIKLKEIYLIIKIFSTRNCVTIKADFFYRNLKKFFKSQHLVTLYLEMNMNKPILNLKFK